MSPSAFLDRDRPPTERALEAVLGKGSDLWVGLRSDLAEEYTPLTEKWSFSGKSHGWILQLRRRQRTILYLVPCPGHFVASFALNEEACRAAEQSKLPARVLEIIRDAPTYAEGRGVQLKVRNERDVAHVETLASIKMAN